jgi:hypothetical protein
MASGEDEELAAAGGGERQQAAALDYADLMRPVLADILLKRRGR